MATPTCNWITPPGIRRTSSVEVIRCLVKASAVGGITDVTFAVSVNGGAASNTVVAASDIWIPDFSDFTDPVTGDLQPAVLAYGIELDMSSLANGTIDVTPTVTPTTGSPVAMPVQRFYNNKTSDTRPSTVQVYMSPTGSDANDGSTSSVPILKVMRAMQLGTVAGNTGGLEVLMMAGTHTMAGGIWFDSTISGPTNNDCHWITFKPAPGVTRAEVKIQAVTDTDFMEFKAANKVRLRFQDLTPIGKSAWMAGASNDTISAWWEHCHFRPVSDSHVGIANPHINATAQDFSGVSTTNAYRDVTCYTGNTWENTPSVGLAAIHDATYGIIHGNLFLNTAGIPVYCHGPGVAVVSNKLSGHRGNGGLQGNMSITGTMSIIESPVNAGKPRVILGSVTSAFDILAGVNEPVNAATALVGSTKWGLDLQGFITHAAGTYYVLGAGNNGSNDWVDIDLAYISDEAAAGSRTLVTALEHDVTGEGTARQTYINLVHVNGPFYTDTTLVSNCTIAHNHCVGSIDLYAGIRFDADGSGASLLRVCVEDNVGFRCDIDVDAAATLNDFIFDRNTMSQLLISSLSTVGADVQITNNIIGSIAYTAGSSKAALEAKLSSALVHHNHFVNDVGTDPIAGRDEWNIGSAGNTLGAGANPFVSGTFVQADAAGDWGVASGSTAFGAATAAYGPAPWDGANQGAAGLGALEGDWSGAASTNNITGAFDVDLSFANATIGNGAAPLTGAFSIDLQLRDLASSGGALVVALQQRVANDRRRDIRLANRFTSVH